MSNQGSLLVLSNRSFLQSCLGIPSYYIDSVFSYWLYFTRVHETVCCNAKTYSVESGTVYYDNYPQVLILLTDCTHSLDTTVCLQIGIETWSTSDLNKWTTHVKSIILIHSCQHTAPDTTTCTQLWDWFSKQYCKLIIKP